MQTSNPQQVLDLRGASCPMAFVKTRLFLDKLANGNIACIRFEDTPSNEPLIRSIRALGHHIVTQTATTLPVCSDDLPKDAANRPPVNTVQLITIQVQVKK